MNYLKTISGRSDGRRVIQTAADRSRYAAVTSYTPERLKAIFDAANQGDIESLCLCGREILERNWDVIGAMEQRSDALTGVEFDIQPGGGSPRDIEAAKRFDEALRSAGELNGLDTFHDLVGHLTGAAVMPFAASEIVWGPGGSLEGFAALEAHHFTLRESFVPRLVCDEYPNGMPEEEAQNRFLFHQFRRKPDPARAGKIRVLAWLHCFQNWPLKDLFSFIERFGMPFVVATVDKKTWDEERATLHHLIRSFGPNGGGVFSQGTQLQLLNAANTGSDNVYFKALEFTHDAIYTLLVGQLASSSDSSGMSNGDAQSSVRQDILEADARAVESTIRAQVAAPWTRFQFGGGVAVPRIHFQVEPAEDQTQLATVVSTLSQGGFKADAAELSKRFSMKLRYEAPAAPGMAMDGFGQNGPQEDADAAHNLNLKQKYDAMGVAIRAGLLTATPEIEAQTRSELGLPVMTPEVRKAWEATGGIRQPITLKTAESAAVEEALNLEEEDPGKIEKDVKALSAEKRLERGEALVAALQWGLIHQTRGTNVMLSVTLGIPADAITLAAEPRFVRKSFEEVYAERSGKNDLSAALEAWFGPVADQAGRIADLSDDEFDRMMKKGIDPKCGDSSNFELLDASNMQKERNRGNQVQG